ncbi:hypothetical protein AB0N05_00885 [Nocardia sp. NPDC051030]|uniref:hypothetical protein n=1 Tax=Nocardia sp. NPDC051030 TaxID=3155162 RepID=UPI003437967A
MTAAVGARPGDSELTVVAGRGWLGAVIGGLLAVDALITLVLEVLFLPIYAGQARVPGSEPVLAMAAPLASTSMTEGAIPVPVTVLVAAIVNVLLVMGMSVVTSKIPVMIIPLMVWTLGFLVCASTGPGGDIMLMSDWPTMLLLIAGLLPAGLYLYWRATSRYGTPAR